MASREWKQFERLVTAVHAAAAQGAEVKWNDHIGGRQFDVTIRFKNAFYTYLTVIECKDYAKPVPVGEVEQFVTKAADARANRAVMASTRGFQSGAQEVAEKHDMTLIHVTESDVIDLSVFGAQWGPEVDALQFKQINLEYADGEKKSLPEGSNAMTYYINQVALKSPSETRTLESVLSELSTRFDRGAVNEYKDNVVDCPPDTQVTAPDDGEIPLKAIVRIHVKTGLVKAKTITGPVKFDPYLLVPDVKVTDVGSGEEYIFSQHNLALGIDTVFEEGRFYEQPALEHYYYCDRIRGGIADIALNESYQHGMLLQAELKVKTKHANFYLPVTDQSVIPRLHRRLTAYRANQASR
jgi:hypothetical protein